MMAFWRPVLYVQLSARTVTVRAVRSGVHITETADIAIRQHGRMRVIAAVGSAAQGWLHQPQVQVLRPFAHPRSLVSDVEVGEALLARLFQQALGRRWLVCKPVVVMHPMGQPEGGYTAVEIQALRNMALGAGARKVHVWIGSALSDAAVLAAPESLPHAGAGFWHTAP